MKLKKSHITISLLVLILTFTVVGTINQSFKPQYNLEPPKASAGEITVVSPENKTYTEPIPIRGEIPSAIYDGTDSRDTIAPQSAYNPVTFEWNITWGLSEFQDWGYGMVLDSSDNIYIVGTTENLKHTYDICLLKFDSLGTLQWNRTWGGDGIERGSGIALDSSGNIYITGYSEYGPEMYLVKYDSEGVLQWNRTRSGQSNAIVLDSSDNIYLTGRIGNGVGLLKYDSEGVEQWVRSWTSGSGPNWGNEIALDSSENIFIVGVASDSQGSYDMCILKYNSSGGLHWSRTWGYSAADYGESIAIDSFDNIYITGQTTNLVTLQYDICLVKYSPSGVQQWDRIWGGSETDYALAITLDWYGDIFLAGYTWNFGSIMGDFLLVKFNGSGIYQWNLTRGGSGEQRGNAMVLDSSQNIYIVGSTAEYDGFGYVADICLMKYTTPPKITIVSPENKTYTAPDSGYYTARYGFENNKIGEAPSDWQIDGMDGSSYIEVDQHLDGHNYVVEQRKNGGAMRANMVKRFDYNATVGSVEFWFYKDTDSGTDATRLYILGDTGDGDGRFEYGFTNGDLHYGFWDTRTVVATDILTKNTWHHIKVEFNISQGCQILVDGVLYGAGYAYPFLDNPTIINGFKMCSLFSGGNPNYGAWIDAIGFSWDPNYNVGDNLNEGLLLSYENATTLEWQGYSLDGQENVTISGNCTIPVPANGPHAIQVFGTDSIGTIYQSKLRHFTVNYEPPADITIITPENKTYTEPDDGYFPATYGFENEPDGTKGLDLTFLDEYYGQSPGAYTDIKVGDGPADGHMKYLAVSDSQGGTNSWGVHHIDAPQSSGTIEFYLWANNPTTVGSSTKRHFMYFRAADNTIAVRMMVYLSSEKIQYYDGSAWQDIAYTTPDTWYHHSMTFDCEAGIKGQFTWVVSDEQGSEIGRVENIEFENDINTIDEIYIGTHVSDYRGHTKWDAFGFSWDPNYNVGDNLDEGLLISYETEEILDWIGYSLDGQDNVTISGNYTIPVPVNGTHTIQILGTDSLGTIYRSNLRYFTYGTTSFPKITIISPTPDEFFSNNAPDFQLSIFGASINTTWYTIDGGLTNITFSGLAGTIDQTEWDILANGVVNLRFYINNTMGNSAYSEVSIYKDTVAPIVTINSPLVYELFGKLPPFFDLSVVEFNISSMWYSLDGGSTNITFQELTGTINQNEWDKYGNGTVIVNFYVKDEAENEGSAQVTVRKEVTPPLITINSPNDNDLFTTIAPSFDITIEEPDLDTTWYTLDDGVTNFIFSGLTGSINQAEWDKFGSGNITLEFYANDSYGFENFAQVTVQKDIGPPVITIISPEQGAVFSSIAPSFNITVFDSQLDSMWYTIDNGLTNITIVSTVGTIDQIEWDKKGEESVPLRFYANDTLGNTAYSENIIIKDTVQPVITINTPDSYDNFGSVPPSFDLSIVETNLDLVWYTLDGGITNISIFSSSGTIDQTEWNKFGNGTVIIQFYTNDLAGNMGLSQVVVLKDIIAPLISIQVPSIADVFGNDAPSFSLSIVDSNLNLVWYTLDNGFTNFSIGSLVGTIDQTEWNKFGNGTITLKFYANDLVGNEGFSQIIIYKDVIGPIITINSPEQDEIISAIAPTFNLTVIDSQLDSMWYTIDDGLTNIIIASAFGTIDQTEWNKKLEGIIIIRFYANDTIGNVAYSEVVVIKNVFYGIDSIELLTPSAYSQLTSNSLEFSWYSLDAGFGAVNFTLQVSNVSDFSFIIFQSANIAETPIVTNLSVPLSITYGQFYWRVRPTYGNYNGSWSDYFSFTLHINNYAPNLVLDECTPSTGTKITIFKITAIYSDLDNNAPDYVEILINGTSYRMEKLNPSDIDYTDGCVYQYLTLLTPSTIAYTISFECSDGAFQYSTISYQGPLVEADSTPSNNQGDNNLNSVNTFAITMTIGIAFGIFIPFIVIVEIKARKMRLGESPSPKIKKKKNQKL